MARDILLAAVIGAQGLNGQVRARLFTDRPDNLKRYGPLKDRSGHAYVVKSVTAARGGEAVLALSGVDNRGTAEALKGVELFVAREDLPATDQEEFYHADLIGLEAQDAEGRVLGTVAAIHNFGAGDVIEIARPDGDSVLLAFTRETVPVVDIAAGRVRVAVPEEDEGGDHVE
ncbi:MAG: ribosome maturation factor RimM [Rhizomicrobium sp.]